MGLWWRGGGIGEIGEIREIGVEKEKDEREKRDKRGEGNTVNILFLTPRDSGKNLGGVERHVKLLTEELVKRGHDVRELSLDESIKETPCSARSLLFKLQAWRYLWRNRELFRWAEVVHVHDVFWWVMPFLPMIYYKSFKESPCHSKNSNRETPWHSPRSHPILVTFHGWEGVCPPTRSAVWQKRLAARLCDGTIGVGDFYRKWYGVKTDRVVWGAVKKSKIKNQKSKIAKSNKGIVFFGRLEEVNGIEVVIEAMRLIRGHKVRPRSTSGSDLSIVFVGDGAWRAQAESVGEVTGMVAEPGKYLVEADVVIASSYLAILEAAAMGARIIAMANNPLKRDYLEGHPLRKYFKICRSADELAREIIKSGEATLRAKLWARRQTAEKLGDEYEKLWKIV